MAYQRRAEPADLQAMWDVRTRAVRVSCAAHYAPDIIDAWCAAPAPERLPGLITAGGALVAEEAGSMLGYAILDLDNGEVDAVFVEPGQQGRGIARDLMAALEAMARQRGLRRLFLSASLNAEPFYQRAGFVSLRRESYPHRSGLQLDSVFMEKALSCGEHGPAAGA